MHIIMGDNHKASTNGTIMYKTTNGYFLSQDVFCLLLLEAILFMEAVIYD